MHKGRRSGQEERLEGGKKAGEKDRGNNARLWRRSLPEERGVCRRGGRTTSEKGELAILSGKRG